MKILRVSVSVFLAGLCGIAWFSTIQDYRTGRSGLARVTTSAESYMNRGLYQLAYKSYNAGLSITPDRSLYEGKLASAKAFYAEHPDEGEDMLVEAYQDMIRLFPEETIHWEDLTQYYLDINRIDNAGRLLKRAQNQGISSERLEAQRHSIYYLFRGMGGNYEWISPSAFCGYYIAKDYFRWKTVSAFGPVQLDPRCECIGAIGEDGKVLACMDSGECVLYSEDGVRYARFPAQITEAKGYGNGLVPVRFKDQETWSYLNEQGEVICQNLENASMFQFGAAFVKPAGGDWVMMNTSGQMADPPGYEDIRLSYNGAFYEGNVLIVKKDGRWMICHSDGTPVSDFSCEEIDRCFGQPVAFRNGGKWGFVTTAGQIYSEPAYEEARSYSGGVAAVRSGELWGFIDPQGRMVIEPQFAEVGYFSPQGSCCVKDTKDSNWRLIQWAVER